MNSPTKSSLAKLGLSSKGRVLRVLILGQSGVGKTALVVRFITKRFIGEYASNQEKICTIQTIFDNEAVQFDILDSPYHLDQEVYHILAASRTLGSTLSSNTYRKRKLAAWKQIFAGRMLTYWCTQSLTSVALMNAIVCVS